MPDELNDAIQELLTELKSLREQMSALHLQQERQHAEIMQALDTFRYEVHAELAGLRADLRGEIGLHTAPITKRLQ
jgi:peptidoglycan hydrolase CwlO-like protein